MPAIYVHDNHPHGKHVAAYTDARGFTHHIAFDDRNAASWFAVAYCGVLDMIDGPDAEPVADQARWAIRDALADMARGRAAAAAQFNAADAALEAIIRTWQWAGVYGFAARDQDAVQKFLAAIEAGKKLLHR